MRSRSFGSFLLATTFACSSEPLAPNSSNGLTLSLAVTRTEIHAGQPDTITVSLVNTNLHAVTINFSNSCQVLPYIADSTGQTVVPSAGGWGCYLAVTRLDLAAGEQRTQTFIWAGSTDFGSESPPLPPGLYSVFATLSAREVQLTTQPLLVQLN